MPKSYSMTDKLHPDETNKFALEYFDVSETDAIYHNLRKKREGHLEEAIDPGKYIRLIRKEDNDVIMSDTRLEWVTNKKLIQKAKGNVLIAGLGIGFILIKLQKKRTVAQITIIEKEQEIIDMICNQIKFNDKVQIINADIYKWIAPRKERYDTIYFDIWNEMSADNLKDMERLAKRYYNRLRAPDISWMGFWGERQCIECKYGYDLSIKLV